MPMRSVMGMQMGKIYTIYAHANRKVQCIAHWKVQPMRSAIYVHIHGKVMVKSNWKVHHMLMSIGKYYIC